jgi:hypothetical protein
MYGDITMCFGTKGPSSGNIYIQNNYEDTLAEGWLIYEGKSKGKGKGKGKGKAHPRTGHEGPEGE